MKGTLFVVSSPSGGGKTSLVKNLLETEDKIELSVSHTTRPPRPTEREGIDYHFVNADDFEAMCKANDFLEHATVFGNRYGTSRSAVTEQLELGTDVVLDIDWQGAEQIRSRMPDSVSIFIVPPSRAVLEQRLRGRRTDSPDVIEKRMRAATAEISHYHEFEYLLINDDFEQAAAELRLIVRACRLRTPVQKARHDALVRELLADDGSIE